MDEEASDFGSSIEGRLRRQTSRELLRKGATKEVGEDNLGVCQLVDIGCTEGKKFHLLKNKDEESIWNLFEQEKNVGSSNTMQ